METALVHSSSRAYCGLREEKVIFVFYVSLTEDYKVGMQPNHHTQYVCLYCRDLDYRAFI